MVVYFVFYGANADCISTSVCTESCQINGKFIQFFSSQQTTSFQNLVTERLKILCDFTFVFWFFFCTGWGGVGVVRLISLFRGEIVGKRLEQASA